MWSSFFCIHILYMLLYYTLTCQQLLQHLRKLSALTFGYRGFLNYDAIYMTLNASWPKASSALMPGLHNCV
jgi:hypothetical protein